MLISHFYENRSSVTEVEKLDMPQSFGWLVGPYRYSSAMKIRQAQTSATYILPDPGELNKPRPDPPAGGYARG